MVSLKRELVGLVGPGNRIGDVLDRPLARELPEKMSVAPEFLNCC
jgi:hypothetical protein